MTLYVSLKLIKRFHIDPATAMVTISERAALVGGTSACLESGDTLLLHDLFHGMMLPSGNDAAYAISEFFGELLKGAERCGNNQNSK